MDFPAFPGLNCYLGCAMAAAAFACIPYERAFARLLPETDFSYNPGNDTFTSRRLFEDMAALGLQRVFLHCGNEKERRRSLHRIAPGTLFLVGMDAYHVPFSPIYGLHHAPHYFLCRKERQAPYFCFDPTYDKACETIPAETLIAHAEDISAMEAVPQKPLPLDEMGDARAILTSHKALMKAMGAAMAKRAEHTPAERSRLITLGRYVECLARNRRLFAHFLTGQDHPIAAYAPLREEGYMAHWDGVKNGLLRSALIPHPEKTLEETYALLERLLTQEMAMATQALSHGA